MTEEDVIKKLETIKVSGYKDYIYNFEAGTILNLIQKQQEEIEHLKNLNNHQSKDIQKAVDYTFELNKEIEEKDKVIDLMAEEIANSIISTCPLEDYNVDLNCKKRCNDNYKECWKQYFERKAKEGVDI